MPMPAAGALWQVEQIAREKQLLERELRLLQERVEHDSFVRENGKADGMWANEWPMHRCYADGGSMGM